MSRLPTIEQIKASSKLYKVKDLQLSPPLQVNNLRSSKGTLHNSGAKALRRCSVDGCVRKYKSRYRGIPFCGNHFMQVYMRDHRPAPKDPRYFLGAYGEAAVRDILKLNGRHVEDQSSKCKFDFRVDGYRVEVKTVTPLRDGNWTVQIQRNGILDEHTDFYIFRLEHPSGEVTHLLLPGPIGRFSFYINRRTLNEKHAKAIAAFYEFARGGNVPKVVAA